MGLICWIKDDREPKMTEDRRRRTGGLSSEVIYTVKSQVKLETIFMFDVFAYQQDTLVDQPC